MIALSRIRLIFPHLFVSLMAFYSSAVSATSQVVDLPSYNKLQAAYITNIAKYVEWPTEANIGPLRLCIFDDGDDLFNLLKESVTTKSIKGRNVSVELLNGLEAEHVQTHCDLIYLNKQPDSNVINAVRMKNNGVHPALWVASPSIEAPLDAVIVLEMEKRRIVIFVNKSELNRSDFKVLSSLLSIARTR